MNMTTVETVLVRPVVRFREFPFGTRGDPSIVEFTSEQPQVHQRDLLRYLRSGLITGIAMGGSLPDYIDRSKKADATIDGKMMGELPASPGLWGGVNEMTDGEWGWHVALIYYVENYNVRLPEEFIKHARRHHWQVNHDAVPASNYVFDYHVRVPA